MTDGKDQHLALPPRWALSVSLPHLMRKDERELDLVARDLGVPSAGDGAAESRGGSACD